MPLIQRIPGVNFTDTSLPLLRRDSIVNAGTVFAYDFKDTYCWPSQTAPTNGTAVKNLADGLADGTAEINGGNSFGFSGGGVVMSAPTLSSAARRINFPTAARLPAGNQGLLFIIWLRQDTQTNPGDAALIAGHTYQAGSESQYFASRNGSTSQLRISCNAVHTNVAEPAVGVLTQLAVARIPNGSGGFLVRAFMNGAQAGADQTDAFATLRQPVNGSLTCSLAGGGGFQQTWCGKVYRVVLEDLGVSGASALAQVQVDYAANASRF